MASESTQGSTDYVARFKDLSIRNISIDTTPTNHPPPEIITRLDQFKLTWSDLPVLAQFAILWDTGFVATSIGEIDIFLQVYVGCGNSMADVALAKSNLPSSVSTSTCTGPHGIYTRLLGPMPSFDQLDPLLNCAIDDHQLPKSNSTSYSEESLQLNDMPVPRIFLHRDNKGETRPVIHTFPQSIPASDLNSCPTATVSVGNTFPCESQINQRSGSPNTCRPMPSQLMDNWLREIQTSVPLQSRANVESSSSINLSDPPPPNGPLSHPPPDNGTNSAALIGGVIGGVALIIGIVIYVLYRRWKNRQRQNRFTSDVRSYRRPHPTQANVQNGDDIPLYNQNRQSAVASAEPKPRKSQLAALTVDPYERRQEVSFDPTFALDKLSQIPEKQLQYDAIRCETLLAAGSCSEIYYGRFHHKVVAIKVIKLNRVHDKDIVEAFTEEIRLMSAFRHPNIVALLGYAWNHESLSSLTAVTEYLSQGNLSRFLLDNQNLHWDLKLSLALDIARALQYLHGLLQPMVIHRDLKSKNILLDWPHAKLSGFGVSRETGDNETLTAGVGSAYYMAPEALRSGYYSVSADMYSFGCVLCELDTQRPLYSELNVPTKRIMHYILEEHLVPSMSPTCPHEIRLLAEKCFHADPSKRPTAFDVARELDNMVNGRHDVGGGII